MKPITILTVILLAISVAASAGIVQILPGTMNSQGWYITDDGYIGGSGQLVNGPAEPPLGSGSAEVYVDDTAREILYYAGYAGLQFNEITSLQYSTYGPSGTLALSLQFNVDYDLTDGTTNWQGRLVYEPYQNGTVIANTWQTWNPLSGVWWASGSPGNSYCPQGSPCTLSVLLSHFPNAGIHATYYGLQFKAGGPWTGGFTGNVDEFTIGTAASETTFDFEYELVAPGSFAKSLTSGPDPVGLSKATTTAYSYTIVLGSGFDPGLNVTDMLPAEFTNVTLVPSCGDATAEVPKGSRGKERKLNPWQINWDLASCDPTPAQTMVVSFETAENPGKGHWASSTYEPTACGPLMINEGAWLGEQVTDSIFVAACLDESSVGCVDADHDGWSVDCGDSLDDDDTVYPGAPELCGDSKDNNLDGTIDENCLL